MKRPQGNTIGMVTVALSLGSVLLFTAAQVSITHLHLTSSLERRQLARNLAETAVAETMQQILLDENFGAAGQSVTADASDYPPGSLGLVSFAAGAEVPRSTNNLRGNSAVAGALTEPVPAHTVQIIALGRVGSLEHKLQVLYHRPAFPKALMASGRVSVTSSVRVSGMDPAVAYPSRSGSLPGENRRPASLGSNSTSRDPLRPAIYLGPGSYISGDVGACGLVKLDSSASVGGEVRNGSGPQPIPDINIDTLIDQASDAHANQMLSGSTGNLEVTWFNGCDGDLTIHGDLNLKDDGVLWVRGNLTVTGGIKGQGLVLVGGNAEIRRGAALSAQNLIALAVKQDVRLVGTDRDSYFFQGLIYSKGDLIARDITVLGAVVVNGPPGRGNMELTNVDLVEAPVAFTQAYGQGFEGIESRGHSAATSIPWPGGGVAVTPRPSLQPLTPQERRYDIKVWTASNVWVFRDKSLDWIRQNMATSNWRTMTDSDGREMRVTQDIPHDEGMLFFGQALLGRLERNDRSLVLDLDFNSNTVLAAGNRSRILLWREL